MNSFSSSRSRTSWRRFISTPVLISVGCIFILVAVVLGYYYVKFSAMIDAKLHGNVFVRASGIYAAPVKLATNTALRKSEIIAYLDRLGYLTQGNVGDEHRGKYILQGNVLEIIPSSDAFSSGFYFPKVRIKFSGEQLQTIYDVDGKHGLNECLLEPELLTSINKDHEKRKIVEYKDLPQNLVRAVTAIEDRRFFDHPGIDVIGLIRAIYHNFTSPDSTQQGASTITQQLVKNFFLTPERTLKRKVAEAFISILLETRMTKEEILQMYCNEIYLGQDGNYSINGVGEASKFYFNKDVINLNLPECALIAALIRGPGYYSPFQHSDRLLDRRKKVLNDMLELSFINQQQCEEAQKAEVKVRSRTVSSNADAPYFLDYLQTQLLEQCGSVGCGAQSLRVYSTVDMELQRAADKALRTGLEQLEKSSKRLIAQSAQLQGALVAINPKTGEVLAMVGGRDYSKTQLNRATDAHRQPGSVFKPIVYTAAIETAIEKEGESSIITPSSQFLDAKETFQYGNGKVYEPDNFGEKYSNESVTVRTALTNSLNVVAVRVAEKVGYWRVAKMAARLGLPKPEPYPSIALGVTEATPLEMARAYTVFPGNGARVEPIAFTRLVDSDGNTISKLTTRKDQSLSPQIACIMTNLLRGPIDHGTAARARALGFTQLAAGKTGTSRDAWFAGFTPNLVCIVYVGLDDNSQLGITGAQAALPIWVNFMKRALAVRPDLGGSSFPEAEGIQKVMIETKSGLLATEDCPDSIEEYFIEGTAPTEPCSLPSFTKEDILPKEEEKEKELLNN